MKLGDKIKWKDTEPRGGQETKLLVSLAMTVDAVRSTADVSIFVLQFYYQNCNRARYDSM